MDALYEDLDKFEDFTDVKKLKEQNQTLEQCIEEKNATIKKLTEDYDNLMEKYKQMELNYSSLLLTARSEIARKAAAILDLNREKDQLVLRTRNFHNNADTLKFPPKRKAATDEHNVLNKKVKMDSIPEIKSYLDETEQTEEIKRILNKESVKENSHLTLSDHKNLAKNNLPNPKVPQPGETSTHAENYTTKNLEGDDKHCTGSSNKNASDRTNTDDSYTLSVKQTDVTKLKFRRKSKDEKRKRSESPHMNTMAYFSPDKSGRDALSVEDKLEAELKSKMTVLDKLYNTLPETKKERYHKQHSEDDVFKREKPENRKDDTWDEGEKHKGYTERDTHRKTHVRKRSRSRRKYDPEKPNDSLPERGHRDRKLDRGHRGKSSDRHRSKFKEEDYFERKRHKSRDRVKVSCDHGKTNQNSEHRSRSKEKYTSVTQRTSRPQERDSNVDEVPEKNKYSKINAKDISKSKEIEVIAKHIQSSIARKSRSDSKQRKGNETTDSKVNITDQRKNISQEKVRPSDACPSATDYLSASITKEMIGKGNESLPKKKCFKSDDLKCEDRDEIKSPYLEKCINEDFGGKYPEEDKLEGQDELKEPFSGKSKNKDYKNSHADKHKDEENHAIRESDHEKRKHKDPEDKLNSEEKYVTKEPNTEKGSKYKNPELKTLNIYNSRNKSHDANNSNQKLNEMKDEQCHAPSNTNALPSLCDRNGTQDETSTGEPIDPRKTHQKYINKGVLQIHGNYPKTPKSLIKLQYKPQHEKLEKEKFSPKNFWEESPSIEDKELEEGEISSDDEYLWNAVGKYKGNNIKEMATDNANIVETVPIHTGAHTDATQCETETVIDKHSDEKATDALPTNAVCTDAKDSDAEHSETVHDKAIVTHTSFSIYNSPAEENNTEIRNNIANPDFAKDNTNKSDDLNIDMKTGNTLNLSEDDSLTESSELKDQSKSTSVCTKTGEIDKPEKLTSEDLNTPLNTYCAETNIVDEEIDNFDQSTSFNCDSSQNISQTTDVPVMFSLKRRRRVIVKKKN